MTNGLRWANARRQDVQIKLGTILLERFPFLCPPAEWAVKSLNRLAKRWGL